MKIIHYDQYLAPQFNLAIDEWEGDSVIQGELISKLNDRRHVPITNSIPRFVESSNYANSFGFQWNRFRETQLDSKTGLPLTARRLWDNTKWSPLDLKGKTILEVGSGAGRFTEIFLSSGAKVVSFDYSNAIEANFQNNAKKGDVFLFQGDLFHIPFANGLFDFVFCYGVLQHTPNPEKAFASITKKLKPGGRISIDVYLKDFKIRPWKSKYLWRPLTTKVAPEKLLRFLRWFIPKWLPFDTVIKHIPVLRNYLGTIIPCFNYFYLNLPKKMKKEWAIMDTFDALAAAYDNPVRLQEVQRWFESNGFRTIEVFKGSNGVVGNGTK